MTYLIVTLSGLVAFVLGPYPPDALDHCDRQALDMHREAVARFQRDDVLTWCAAYPGLPPTGAMMAPPERATAVYPRGYLERR